MFEAAAAAVSAVLTSLVLLYRLVMRIKGAKNSLYAGEEYLLQFRFPDNYPMESPEVMFIGSCIPVHPHIYSNGHLCLNILDKDWSPILGIESICLSIVSMLSSCEVKEKPRDDAMYVRNSVGRSPKQVRVFYCIHIHTHTHTAFSLSVLTFKIKYI